MRYFTDWALPQLDTLIDETNEPIDVWTTLDPAMQTAANRAVNAHVPGGAQGALVAIDRDGAVRAMVGGRDYVSSIYNRATQAERQPGSAFKLFVYLTALENGMKPTDTVVDEPVTIDGWTPRNSTRTNLGPVTLREAFSRSINTISAKIGEQFGFGTIADMARRFGVGTEISTYPSMVLGTSDVRLIDMTRAFASVANRGVSVMPYAIRQVVTAEGRLLYSHERADERVLVAPWVAAGMTDLLQSAVLSGTGRAAQIGRPVAGKTGTTQSNKDGWFIGFSSGLTTGVWMGRDNARAGRRPAGRNRAGPRVPRFHARRRGPAPGREVRDRRADARLAARARRGSIGTSPMTRSGRAGDGRRERHADRAAAGRPAGAIVAISGKRAARARPGRARPHLQQSAAASPAASATAAAAAARQTRRPIPFSRGAIRRSSERAAATSPP